MTVACLSVSGQSSWYVTQTGIDQDINDLEFVNSEIGLAVADSGVLIRTTNGGATWELIDLGVTSDLLGVGFADQNTVIVVGEGSLVKRSTDQGKNWSDVVIDNVAYGLCDVDFDMLTGKGVIGGHTESIITSDDKGQTWTIQDDGWTEWYRRVQMVNGMQAQTYGKNYVGQSLIGFTNDWDYWDFSWFYVTYSPGVGESGNARDGYFFGEEDGFIIGYTVKPGFYAVGFLAPYYDWYNDFWPATEFPYALEGIDFQGDYGIMVGGDYNGTGYITESHDRGLTWTEVPVVTHDVTFTKVQLVGTTGYIGGEAGTILKMDGFTGAAEPKREETVLYNYPNPARENTQIVYELVRAGQVTLELHDASGRLVRTLHDGNQEAGLHRVDVNTAGLMPGIYIYTLETGTRASTGKMTVVR